MLILTRKTGESLYIGDVKVTIVEIKGNQIRVGIDAPSDVRIYREEIYLQILRENKNAAEGVLLDAALDELSGGWKGVSQSDAHGVAKRSLSAVQAQSPDVLRKRRPGSTNSPKGEVKKES